VADTVPVSPRVADGIAVAYLDPAAPWAGEVGADPTGTVMDPAVAATVQLVYDDTTAGVNHSETFEAVIYPIDGLVDGTELINVDHDDRDFRVEPPDGADFRLPRVDLDAKAFWSGLEQDLKSHLVAHRPAHVFKNPGLKLYSRVGEGEDEFRERCRTASEDAADVEMAKLKDRFQARIDRVQDQIRVSETRMAGAEDDAASRQQEEVLSGAGDLLGALLGGRRRSNPLGRVASRRSATQRARARAQAESERLTDKMQELEELEDELATEVNEIVARSHDLAEAIEEVDVPLEKSDVRVVDLKLVWIPVS
jgi:hypothetical protein